MRSFLSKDGKVVIIALQRYSFMFLHNELNKTRIHRFLSSDLIN